MARSLEQLAELFDDVADITGSYSGASGQLYTHGLSDGWRDALQFAAGVLRGEADG